MTTPDRPDFEAALAAAWAKTAAQSTCDRHPDSLRDALGCCIDCESERLAEVERHYWLEALEGQIRERVPLRYQAATTEHPQVLAWAKSFAADPHHCPSLLLLGPTGVGKTHTAFGALRAALTARRANWSTTTTADMLAHLRPRQGVDTEGVLERYRTTLLLLIDDFGIAKGSEWVEETTYRVINGRYEQMRPTIFTTNYTIAELKAAVGDRIASRLAETCTRVVLDGPDRRRLP